ncbi:MAG: hypothetical protein RL355_1155 [Actinomycetota bacterium]|jgi:DNA-binding transcriptional MerR regulator
MPSQKNQVSPNAGPEILLSVATVARRIGVAPATLRTWDRRYGIGPSNHDSGQNRLYSLSDVARLELMRNLVVQGLSPAKAAAVAVEKDLAPANLRVEVDRNLQLAEKALPDNVHQLGSPENVVRGLIRAANMLDQESCRTIVCDQLEQKGVLWSWERILVPALQNVGQKWEQTGQGIEVEHLLVEVIESQLRFISTSIDEAVNARPILLACTAHELHTLPIHAIAAGLAEHDIACRILGARLPAESLMAAVKKIGPSAVVVWSQTRGTAEPEIWTQIKSQRPNPLLVAAGPGWEHLDLEGVSKPIGLADALIKLARSAV